MNILLSGASGFLGRILYSDFISNGHEVDTIGRGTDMTFSLDLSSTIPSIKKSYDVVVHAAGKAHMLPKNQEEVQQFIDVNVQGTENLLKGFGESNFLPKQIVFISSVAVYGLEKGEGITEDYPLKGSSPYAKSKIAAESIVQKWAAEYKVPSLIFRLPLIAGPNAPGNLAAMIQAISKGYYFRIGAAQNRKSILLARDVAIAILTNASKEGIYNLTDGKHPTLAQIEEVICKQLGKKVPISIPIWLLKMVAFLGDFIGEKAPINTYKLEKLTSTLTFNSNKAAQELNFKPHAFIHSGF